MKKGQKEKENSEVPWTWACYTMLKIVVTYLAHFGGHLPCHTCWRTMETVADLLKQMFHHHGGEKLGKQSDKNCIYFNVNSKETWLHKEKRFILSATCFWHIGPVSSVKLVILVNSCLFLNTYRLCFLWPFIYVSVNTAKCLCQYVTFFSVTNA